MEMPVSPQLPLPIDGVSFTTALRGKPRTAARSTGITRTTAIRATPHGRRAKALEAHEWYEDGRLELFNLADDIGEKTNLAKKHPDKVKALATKLAAWRVDTRPLPPITPTSIPANAKATNEPTARTCLFATTKGGSAVGKMLLPKVWPRWLAPSASGSVDKAQRSSFARAIVCDDGQTRQPL